VGEALLAFFATEPRGGLVAVDAVRTTDQADAVASLVPTIEVHLTAPLDVLAARYERRREEQPALELDSLEDVRMNATEAAVMGLANRADLVVDTSLADPSQTLQAVVARLHALRLLPRS
jgi:RNase adaptor protein for sRNA GlmZ degradation